MDEFCGSRLWDISVSWNVSNPDLTPCFQKTFLVWLPCGTLWLLAPVEFYCQSRRKHKNVTWTGLAVLKMFLAICLVGFSLADIVHNFALFVDGRQVSSADFCAAFIKCITYILVTVMIYWGMLRNVHTSGVQFIFWLLSVICNIVIYRSMLLKVFSENTHYNQMDDIYTFVIVVCTFPLIVGQFVLTNVSDGVVMHREKNVCPEDTSSFLSQLTFWWFNSMVIDGRKRPLTLERIWRLSESNGSQRCIKKFDKYWRPASNNDALLHSNGTPKILSHSCDTESLVTKEDRSRGVLFPILKAFRAELFLSGLLKLAGVMITFSNPILLNKLIDFVSGSEPYWHGFFYASLIFVVSMLESVLNTQCDYLLIRVGMKVRACLTSALFKKALSLSNTTRKNYTVGEIVNLMAIDTQRVLEEIHIFHLLWSIPLQILISLFMLWNQIGISALAGLGIMLLMIPFNGFTTNKLKKLQRGLMKEKDKRMKLTGEILSGIKALKLYGWEESFEEQVMRLRRQEIRHLKTMAVYSTLIHVAFASAPFFVAVASFGTFVLMSPANILDANKAFVSLSLFNILRMPLTQFPMVITLTTMFIESLKRLNKFLNGDELDPNAIESSNIEDTPVSVENGSFSWSKDGSIILKEINLNVKKGSLVAVVGQVGTGKSSLLSALLGEMEKLNGRVAITGKVAYVPQQAFIQNTTLRKNILFNKHFEEQPYHRILSKCCLEPDLEILPGGDNTEIGEKGINLSGGQKQRVSLARAVYSDADIYLLDDPLSAVDSHVSKDLFKDVISNSGLLRKKTRILVTHRLTVLPSVDTIVVLKDGMISEMGSYKELLMQKGDFSDFLVHYLMSEGMEDMNGIVPDDLREHIINAVGSPELQRQLSELSSGESGDNSHEMKEFSRQVSQVSQTGSCRGRLSSATTVAKTEKEDENRRSSHSRLIDAEVAQIGSVNWRVYKSFFKACGIPAALVVFSMFFLSCAFNVGSSIWLSMWSNDAEDLSTEGDTARRDLRLGVYAALGTGESLSIMFGSFLLLLAGLRASKHLHNSAFHHILMGPMSFFDTTPMGRILNRFSKDVDTVDTNLRFNVRMILMSVFRTISTLFVITLQSAYIFVAVLPLGILYYALQVYYIATTRQLKRLESVSKSPVFTHFSESITGSTSIRAYGATDVFIKESNRRVDVNHSSYFLLFVSNRWLEIRLEFLGYCISFFTALFAVLTKESITPGLAGLAISYAMTVTGTLNVLIRTTCNFETNIVSVERLLEYTQTPTEAVRRNEEIKPNPGWPSEGRIEFDSYSARYRTGLNLVLKNISLTMEPGQKIGIVGRTGAGKSSLALSIFRLIESAGGRILIDGLDIAKIGLYDLREKLTIIPQDPVLFAGSLRLNLDPFEEYTDQDLWEALEHSHLKAFVTSLEKGLIHDVAEGGENLSVGQRQLFCLARALLRKTKILVLDEATAAVDMETDDLIQRTIRSAFADCTVLTIAHRLNTILDYDKVLLLNNGEISEYDSPEILLHDSKSAFYAMAKDANVI